MLSLLGVGFGVPEPAARAPARLLVKSAGGLRDDPALDSCYPARMRSIAQRPRWRPFCPPPCTFGLYLSRASRDPPSDGRGGSALDRRLGRPGRIRPGPFRRAAFGEASR